MSNHTDDQCNVEDILKRVSPKDTIDIWRQRTDQLIDRINSLYPCEKNLYVKQDAIIQRYLFVKEDATINGNVIVDGNLTIKGTETVVNTVDSTFKDNLIKLNYDEYNTGVYLSDLTSGIEVNRGVVPSTGLETSTTQKLYWDEPAERWVIEGDLNVKGDTYSNENVLWRLNSSDIYYNTGNVGIGTDDPQALLEVKNTTTNADIRINGVNGGLSGVYFGDQADTVRGAIEFDSTENTLSLRGYNNEQRLTIDSSGDLRVSTQIYNDGWFRNTGSGEGLYHESNQNYFYSRTPQYWHIASKSDQTSGGLGFYKGHNNGSNETNRKGYVHWDGDGFGLLDNDGSWAFRTVNNESQLFYDGVEKLNTTSTGVNVTGDLDVSGNITCADSVTITDTTFPINGTLLELKATATSTNGTGAYDGIVQKIYADGAYSQELNNDNFYGLHLDISQLGGVQDKYAATFVGGNVGIGTHTPSEKLEVGGAIKLGDTPENNKGSIKFNGSDFLGYDGTVWTSLTQVGAGKWLESPDYDTTGNIYYNNNVGIGTNDPSANLEVSNNSNSGSGAILRLSNMSAGIESVGTSAGEIEFYKGDISGGAGLVGFIKSVAVDLGEKYNLVFGSGNSSNLTGRMVIDSDGKVGIGTTAPSAKLHVLNRVSETWKTSNKVVDSNCSFLLEDYESRLQLVASNQGSYSSTIVLSSVDSDLNADDERVQSNWSLIHRSANSGDGSLNKFQIAHKNVSTTDLTSSLADHSSNKYLTIDTSGNVGIGTESPEVRLHVNGSAILGDWISKKSFFHNKNQGEDNYIILIEYDTNSFASGKVEGFRNGDTNHRREIIFDFSCNSTAYPETPTDTEGAIFVRMGALLSGTDLGGFYSLEYDGKKYLSIKVPPSYNYHALSWNFQGRHSGTDDNFFKLVGYSDLTEAQKGSITLVEDYIQLDNHLYRKGENFGIGETDPNTKLHVVDSNEIVATLTNSTNDDNTKTLLRFSQNVDSDNVSGNIGINRLGANAGCGFEINLADGNGNEQNRLTILEDGNVGIGTSSNPSGYRLDVTGGRAIVRGSTEGVLVLDDSGVADASRPMQYISSDGGLLKFGNANRTTANGTTNSVNRMVIDSDGNVEIGTSSTSVDLKVNNNTVYHTGNFTPTWTSGTNLIHYTSGNVGIGTVEPSEKLHVDGDSFIDGVLKLPPKQISKVLTASDAGADENFGTSVALSSDGSVLAVGANLRGGTYNYQGGVYIYDWSGSSWVQRGSVLTAPAPDPTDSASASSDDRFGSSVALSSDGSVLAVGAISWDGTFSGQGAVYIYDLDKDNDTRTLRGSSVLTADTGTPSQDPDNNHGNDRFGTSVALSSDGSILAVGAEYWDRYTNSQGAVYIYDWSDTDDDDIADSWNLRGNVLHLPSPFGATLFGSGVALSSDGSILVVGSEGSPGSAGNTQGAVYIYDWSDTDDNGTADSWVQRGNVLTAELPAAGDRFGGAVALSSDGSILVVGAPEWDGPVVNSQGTVYIYDLDKDNDTRTLRGSSYLTPDKVNSTGRFGSGVALSSDGSILAVGAQWWDGIIDNQGGVYTYSLAANPFPLSVSDKGYGLNVINDNIVLNSNVDITGDLGVSGAISAVGDIESTSDIRIKENLEIIENPIEKIKELNGYTFNKNGEEKRSAGLIAQEVEKVLPEVVSENSDGIKSLAYGNIVALLVETVKEQQKQIDELKKQISDK